VGGGGGGGGGWGGWGGGGGERGSSPPRGRTDQRRNGMTIREKTFFCQKKRREKSKRSSIDSVKAFIEKKFSRKFGHLSESFLSINKTSRS